MCPIQMVHCSVGGVGTCHNVDVVIGDGSDESDSSSQPASKQALITNHFTNGPICLTPKAATHLARLVLERSSNKNLVAVATRRGCTRGRLQSDGSQALPQASVEMPTQVAQKARCVRKRATFVHPFDADGIADVTSIMARGYRCVAR